MEECLLRHVRLLALCACLFSIIGACAVSAAADSGATLHVSPKGKDAWSGRLKTPNAEATDGPLASLAGAQAAVRRLRRAGPQGPVTVEFADGVYPIAETLVFTHEDSGTKDAPVTYRAAEGARPVLSGGRAISGWTKHPTQSLWTVTLPDVKCGAWSFRQLFVNGRRGVRARYPNQEALWSLIEQVLEPHDKTTAVFHKDDAPFPRNLAGAEAVLFRSFDISRVGVASVAPKERRLTLDIKSRPVKAMDRWKGDRRYYVENALSLLDAPGEWHLNVKTGELSLKPFEGDSLADAAVVAPVVDRLIRFAGAPGKPAEHIHFEGLSFEHSGWNLDKTNGQYDGHQADVAIGAAIEADFAQCIEFTDCTFRHLGRYAVWFRKGCRDNRIRRCEFADLAGGAVEIGRPRGDIPKHETARNEVSECHIHDCGVVWHGAVGVWIGAASQTRVAGNHIHDIPYTGISLGWCWADKPSGAHHNIIENNHIHRTMTMMEDGGGIYCLGRQDGTVLRGNIIHDIMGRGGYSLGIYTDAGSSGMLIENNLVVRVAMSGIGMGLNDNVVRNNIIAMTSNRASLSQQGTGRRVERNIVTVAGGHVYRYGGLWPTQEYEKGNDFFDHNLYYQVRGEPLCFPGGYDLDERRKRGVDVHSIYADPLFVDAAGGDFRLRPDSPALKLGFKPFPLTPIGPNPANDPETKRRYRILNVSPRQVRTRLRQPVPTIEAQRCAARITVDGRVTGDEWRGVAPVAIEETPGGHKQERARSVLRVAHDGRHLYVLFENPMDDMKTLRAKARRWGADDGVQVCLQRRKASAADAIYVLRGFAPGAFEMEAIDPACSAWSRGVSRGVAYKTSVGDGRWFAECRISLKELGIDPRAGRVRFNVGVRFAARDAWVSWVGTGAENWRLGGAGELVLAK